MTIRNCISADRDAVNRLCRQSSLLHAEGVPDVFVPEDEAFSETQWEGLLGNDHAVLLCAERDGAVCGFCHLTRREQSGFRKMKNVHIENIVVDESCRGQGTGHALLAESERLAKEWGAVHINLLCWSFNKNARRLYESLGMEPLYTFLKKDL